MCRLLECSCRRIGCLIRSSSRRLVHVCSICVMLCSLIMDQTLLNNRSTIFCWLTESPFVSQAALFLNTVGIRHAPSHLNAFHQAWHQAQGRPSQDQRLAKDWTDAFAKLSLQRPEADWVSAFSNLQHVPETSQASVQDSNETKDISSALIQQMANDPDPKFRNSKFLQFVQKINSGALVIEGDQVSVYCCRRYNVCLPGQRGTHGRSVGCRVYSRTATELEQYFRRRQPDTTSMAGRF